MSPRRSSLRHLRVPRTVETLLRFALIGLLAAAIFGPLLNMLVWTVAEAWYFPAKLPQRWGFAFWSKVFRPEAGAMKALSTSMVIACTSPAKIGMLMLPASHATGCTIT